jgi:hypothetical protein
MTDKLVPALIGGAALGILCTIFFVAQVPFIPLCCCIWAIGGGVLASMMYVKKSPTRVSVGEGAMLGAMAGVIGGAIFFVLSSLVFGLIFDIATFERQFRASGYDMPLAGFAMILVTVLICAIFLFVLSVGGGAIGIAIFEKRKDGDAPPAPPAFGGQPGGGYPGGGSNVGASG